MSDEVVKTVIGKDIILFGSVAEALGSASTSIVYSAMAARQKIARQNGREWFSRSINQLTREDLLDCLSRTTVANKLRRLEAKDLIERRAADDSCTPTSWSVDLSILGADGPNGIDWQVELSDFDPSNACRVSVFERDGFSCVFCGRGPDEGAALELDHIVPRSKGGDDHADNLQTLCAACNQGKGDRLVDGPRGGES